MTPNEYQIAALRTNGDESFYEEAYWRIGARTYPDKISLLHALVGIVDEAGEFAKVIKHHIYYGRPLDAVNVVEELGDLLWYIALACDALGQPMETVMERNIAKLQARYPAKFEDVVERDHEAERAALEGK